MKHATCCLSFVLMFLLPCALVGGCGSPYYDEQAMEDAIGGVMPSYLIRAQFFGSDGCPLAETAVQVQLVERGAEPGGEPPAIMELTFPTGDLSLLRTYGGHFDLGCCVTEEELASFFPEEWRVPELDRVVFSFEIGGVPYTVVVEVTEELLPDFTWFSQNKLDVGRIVIAPVRACNGADESE